MDASEYFAYMVVGAGAVPFLLHVSITLIATPVARWNVRRALQRTLGHVWQDVETLSQKTGYPLDICTQQLLVLFGKGALSVRTPAASSEVCQWFQEHGYPRSITLGMARHLEYKQRHHSGGRWWRILTPFMRINQQMSPALQLSTL